MPREMTAQEFKEASWALRMYLRGSDEGEHYQVVLDFLAQMERQRNQLLAVCEHWLKDARFLTANTDEYDDAVEMLKNAIDEARSSF